MLDSALRVPGSGRATREKGWGVMSPVFARLRAAYAVRLSSSGFSNLGLMLLIGALIAAPAPVSAAVAVHHPNCDKLTKSDGVLAAGCKKTGPRAADVANG